MPTISRIVFDWPPRRLLLLAALLHLFLALGLYSIGRFRLAPNQVDEHGVLARALPDSAEYRDESLSAADVLRIKGVRRWWAAPYDAHVKFYSLSNFVFDGWVGANILSAEPLNLFYYLSIVWLTFILGREAFNRRVGRVAAWMVALWPSLMVHTIQILKDPLCLAAMLAFMLALTLCLTRVLSWPSGLATALMAAIANVLIYSTRSGFWVPIILGLVLIGMTLLLIRLVLEKTFLPANLASMAMILIASIGVLLFTQDFFPRNPKKPAATPNAIAETGTQAAAPPTTSPQTEPSPAARTPAPSDDRNRLVIQIQQVRDSFVYRYLDSGTLIDSDVKFFTTWDVIRYAPRAIEIGFMAPFPNQWISSGVRVGRAGRLLGGAEMLVTYAIEALALFGLWRSRNRLPAWLLCLATLFGVTALGFGLINVGALYRIRYAFFLLLIILGSNGLVQVLDRISGRRELAAL